MPERVLDIPATRQQESHTCGPASIRAVLKTFGIRVSEDALKKLLHTTEKDGTAPEQVENAARILGLNPKVYEPMDVPSLKREVYLGHPVIILFQAWQEGQRIRDWGTDWSDGHYAVVTAVHDDQVLLTDPSLPSGSGYVPIREFVSRWHDKNKIRKYHNWGLALQVDSPSTLKKHFDRVK